jgi:hypothetical protein
MTSLAEFHRFPDLPTEIRLAIWDLIPFPNRIIGLVPSATEWCNNSRAGPAAALQLSSQLGIRALQEDTKAQQPYQFRYTVQPRTAPIFPLLHVNRESRDMWLSRLYFVPRRLCEVQGKATGRTSSSPARYMVQFDTPYINYDADIFVAYEAWSTGQVPDHPAAIENEAGQGHANDMDVLLGLDRTRIRHVGVSEIPGDAEDMIQSLDLLNLPALQKLSFITPGPDVLSQDTPLEDSELTDLPPSPWRELHPMNIPAMDCVVRDIPDSNTARHPLLNDRRLLHPLQITPNIRPLPNYTAFALSWIWHVMSGFVAADSNLEQARSVWWDYTEYVLASDDDDDAECPLAFEGCGEGGHGRREMLDWKPPLEVGYKLLCPEIWLEAVEKLGVLNEDYVTGSDGIAKREPPGLSGLF